MKNFILLLASVFFITTSYSQSSNSCTNLSLKTDAKVRKAEPCVVFFSDYILSHSIYDTTNIEYGLFLIFWMEKTPDYSFVENRKIMDICYADTIGVSAVYRACLSKAAIQLKTDFDKEAVKMFVNYIKNPAYGVNQTAEVKKLIEDYNADNLDAYVRKKR